MDFTKSQIRAITHPLQNVQLIACAGSGKTVVVAQRVAHILKPSKRARLLPRNIIAFTFTDRAAAELRERIVSRVREAHGDVHGLAEMYVGTIHAFCLHLLMTEMPEHLKYEVLNEVQQTLFVDRHSRESGLTQCTDLDGNHGEQMRENSCSDMAILLRSVRRNGQPITNALKRADIPYVVAGMNNLFDTAEASAARQLFYFLDDRPDVDARTVENAWQDANLGAVPADLRRAVANAERAKLSMNTDEEERWRVYNIQRQYLAFLEEAGIREEKVPDGRSEVVFYNLEKLANSSPTSKPFISTRSTRRSTHRLRTSCNTERTKPIQRAGRTTNNLPRIPDRCLVLPSPF